MPRTPRRIEGFSILQNHIIASNAFGGFRSVSMSPPENYSNTMRRAGRKSRIADSEIQTDLWLSAMTGDDRRKSQDMQHGKWAQALGQHFPACRVSPSRTASNSQNPRPKRAARNVGRYLLVSIPPMTAGQKTISMEVWESGSTIRPGCPRPQPRRAPTNTRDWLSLSPYRTAGCIFQRPGSALSCLIRPSALAWAMRPS